MKPDETAQSGTRKKGREQFLEAYAQCGCVAEACRRSGTSASTHYWRLERFSNYRKMFAEAHRAAIRYMAEEARRRAVELRKGGQPASPPPESDT